MSVKLLNCDPERRQRQRKTLYLKITSDYYGKTHSKTRTTQKTREFENIGEHRDAQSGYPSK